MAGALLTLFYCDHHAIPLPPGHKFPTQKYGLIRERLRQDPRIALHEAEYAPLEDIMRVHAKQYVRDFLSGTLDRSVIRRIGFPWSEGLVRRTLASVGGTLRATQQALDTGIGGNLAGGTHHAFRTEGSGFCVFNDLAVAAEWARHRHGLNRIAIVDLDVHQGDGTAAIFAGDHEVYTLSLHGAGNFPFRKQKSTCDIDLPDGTADEEYLETLGAALPAVWAFGPELLFFQSGVDTLASDRLGRLSLSRSGIAKRDYIVMSEAASRNIPLVITLGGGYSDPIEETVAAHARTFETAAAIFVSGHRAAFAASP